MACLTKQTSSTSPKVNAGEQTLLIEANRRSPGSQLTANTPHKISQQIKSSKFNGTNSSLRQLGDLCQWFYKKCSGTRFLFIFNNILIFNVFPTKLIGCRLENCQSRDNICVSCVFWNLANFWRNNQSLKFMVIPNKRFYSFPCRLRRLILWHAYSYQPDPTLYPLFYCGGSSL